VSDSPPDPTSNATSGTPLSGDPDAADVRAAQAGDALAWQALVERHHQTMTALLWRFTRERADLEDLVQETFLRMVRHLPTWRAEQPFAHWLRRVAVNVGRDYCRRMTVRHRHAAGSWQSDPDRGEGARDLEARDRAPDPAARAAADEIKQLLSRLPPDDRALLTLHYLEGWPLADVAATFGWTLTATKLRAMRARARFRATLSPQDLA
jgi:RNA polymerase sigma-70 factor, ECF subfamily